MTERKYPTRDSGPMYNFPMPTETLRGQLAEACTEIKTLKVDVAEARGIVFDLDEELGAAKAQVDAALRLHTPERRYTTTGGEASWETAEDCAEDNDIPLEAVKHFDVCVHCASIETGDDSDRDYRESLWPCDTAKSLGVTDAQ